MAALSLEHHEICDDCVESRRPLIRWRQCHSDLLQIDTPNSQLGENKQTGIQAPWFYNKELMWLQNNHKNVITKEK